MPRPRTPTRALELKGSFRKHPERRRPLEPTPNGPIGEAPVHFNDAERAAWYELIGILPQGVAADCDRWAIEVLSRLMVRFRTEDDFPAALLAQMNNLMGRFGMTASDRAKLSVPVRKEEDPLKEFITARPQEEAVQ